MLTSLSQTTTGTIKVKKKEQTSDWVEVIFDHRQRLLGLLKSYHADHKIIFSVLPIIKQEAKNLPQPCKAVWAPCFAKDILSSQLHCCLPAPDVTSVLCVEHLKNRVV